LKGRPRLFFGFARGMPAEMFGGAKEKVYLKDPTQVHFPDLRELPAEKLSMFVRNRNCDS
jgi:hypothetical protein